MITGAAREKVCAVCGRRMTYRRKWKAVWDEVRYCSERCRRRRAQESDQALEHQIVDLLERRPSSSSICPSEAARAAHPDAWREHMETARSAGRRLEARGIVEFRQAGRRVDPSRARGPVRLVRGLRWNER